MLDPQVQDAANLASSPDKQAFPDPSDRMANRQHPFSEYPYTMVGEIMGQEQVALPAILVDVDVSACVDVDDDAVLGEDM